MTKNENEQKKNEKEMNEVKELIETNELKSKYFNKAIASISIPISSVCEMSKTNQFFPVLYCSASTHRIII